MELVEREGKVIIKAQVNNGIVEGKCNCGQSTNWEYNTALLALENELNGPISSIIYKKYGIAVRFHL